MQLEAWEDLIYGQQFLMSTPTLTLQLANSLSSICGTVSEHLKQASRTLASQEGSESESFQPEYHQIKKLGLKINKKKICSGGWSTRENQIYLQFMIQNSQDFMTETSRRKTKVFYRLSKILRRRTPDQCRSHHQKLQLKYKQNLRAIIDEVERKVHTCALQDYLSKQQEMQRREMEPFRMALLAEPPKKKYKTVASCNWYSIKSSGSCLKLSIDCSAIAEW